MTTVSSEIPVALSPAEAWQKLSDLSQPDMYVQGLTHVEFTTELTQGVGASRQVTQGKSLRLDETVVEWREGEGFSLRLHRGDKGPIPPLSSHFFDYSIIERDGHCYLSNSMRYTVGLGLFGRLLDSLLLRRVMASQLRDVTLAQKLFYETGDKVTAAALKAARSADLG